MPGIKRGLSVALDGSKLPKPKASAAALVRKADGTPRVEGIAPNQLDPRIKTMLTADERKQLGIPY